MGDILLTIAFGFLMLLGLIGCVVPVLPDLILIWGAALGFGLAVGWGARGPWYFGLISLLGLLGAAAEVWVSGYGARKGGASIWAILTGMALGTMGLLTSGPFGAVIGMLGGIFLVEYLRKRDIERATKAMLGTGLGCGASLGVKLGLGIGMVVVWVLWVLGG
ncbi:MAG: DUF456 family protein [Anaerolineales bacterium]|nr:DUF456 family protein [Anaerolineales bacterium]